jgi:hypothetical protein
MSLPLAGKFDPADKLKLEGSTSDEASKDEYELRQKELEGIANPCRS